tara:strand:- start:4561 stop:4959 length:399 start_codon:yes stop_codon:yes gene_type:complete
VKALKDCRFHVEIWDHFLGSRWRAWALDNVQLNLKESYGNVPSYGFLEMNRDVSNINIGDFKNLPDTVKHWERFAKANGIINYKYVKVITNDHCLFKEWEEFDYLIDHKEKQRKAKNWKRRKRIGRRRRRLL